MKRAVLTLGLAALGLLGCKGSPGARSPSGGAAASASCDRLASDLTAFGEVLEIASADAKVRSSSYAGVLELLLSFERASAELDGDLAQIADRDLADGVKKTRASLAKSIQFAQSSRAAMEQHAKEIAPLAKETQQAWTALRSACDGKGKAPDCAAVRAAIAKFDGSETNDGHDKAITALAAVHVTTPAIVKARDRATTASRAVQVAIKARSETTSEMPRRWLDVQKDLSASVDGLMESCHGEVHPTAQQLVAAAHPDPRKLTVLVHVKPPAGVEKQLLGLAASATDADEKAFYKARAEGAFGSGFFLVRRADKGGGTEVLVVTNRHVVELGDKAALELADGTSLGNAEIVYSSPAHDLAVLRPATKLGLKEGFAFADQPAKDQQTVIATGFPGMIGRPSYQTTKGYVSNESFKLDEDARPLTYVQHTAPIDPGSSGGPLTDESGKVLGVNTLKVTGREGVGLAVPSKYVLSTLQTAEGVEAHHANAPARAKDARLACLAFIAEMGLNEPRMLVVEQMISNHLVSTDGLESAAALAGESGFEDLWNDDSVRAMRIAALVKVRALIASGGGPSVLETCDEPDLASAKPDWMKYKIRLANFETRDLALRWEHGRWKIDGVSGGASGPKPPSKKLPPPGGSGGGKKIAPPKKK
jgi:serine protease Do